MTEQFNNTAVLSRKTVTAFLSINAMTTSSGSLWHYLTLCNWKESHICKISMLWSHKRPYVHTVFWPNTSLQLRLFFLHNFADTAFLVNSLAIHVREISSIASSIA